MLIIGSNMKEWLKEKKKDDRKFETAEEKNENIGKKRDKKPPI